MRTHETCWFDTFGCLFSGLEPGKDERITRRETHFVIPNGGILLLKRFASKSSSIWEYPPDRMHKETVRIGLAAFECKNCPEGISLLIKTLPSPRMLERKQNVWLTFISTRHLFRTLVFMHWWYSAGYSVLLTAKFQTTLAALAKRIRLRRSDVKFIGSNPPTADQLTFGSPLLAAAPS